MSNQTEIIEERPKQFYDKQIKQPEDFKPYKIYMLKRIFVVGHDEYEGKVIVALSARAARKQANLKYGEEGPIWTDSNQVMCRERSLTMPMIVLESFNAG